MKCVDGHAAMYSCTVVTVLVAWTKIWYKFGSPSFGTKLVCTIGANLLQRFPGKDIVEKALLF